MILTIVMIMMVIRMLIQQEPSLSPVQDQPEDLSVKKVESHHHHHHRNHEKDHENNHDHDKSA